MKQYLKENLDRAIRREKQDMKTRKNTPHPEFKTNIGTACFGCTGEHKPTDTQECCDGAALCKCICHGKPVTPPQEKCGRWECPKNHDYKGRHIVTPPTGEVQDDLESAYESLLTEIDDYDKFGQPASHSELDWDKVKAFIRTRLVSQKSEIQDKVEGMIKRPGKYKDTTKNGTSLDLKRKGYNRAVYEFLKILEI